MTENTPLDRPDIAPGSPADRTAVDAASPPDGTPVATASAVTNKAARRWDVKTPQGRRTRDLFRSLMRMVGNPAEPAKQAMCISAAELMTWAVIVREASLKVTTAMSIETVTKAVKAMRIALAALGIDKAPAPDESDQGYGLFVDDDEDQA